MWSPAVVWRRRSRLLPAGRPYPVQELQRTPHPGPLGQNLHRLLTNLYLNLLAPGLTDPRTAGALLIAACSLTVSVENRYFNFLLTSVRLLPLHFLYYLGTSFVMFSSAFVRQWPDLQAAWAPLYQSSTLVLPTYSLHMSFYFIFNTFKDNESTHGCYRFQSENNDFFPHKGHTW